MSGLINFATIANLIFGVTAVISYLQYCSQKEKTEQYEQWFKSLKGN